MTTTYTLVDPTGRTFQKGPVHSVAAKYGEPMAVVWIDQWGEFSAVILYPDGKEPDQKHQMPTMERALEWIYQKVEE